MTEVALDGLLVCRDPADVALVGTLLPTHVALTRAEPGCLTFAVEPTADPFVWSVRERFADAASFRAHRARAAASEWGAATAPLERRSTVTGLDD